MSGIRLALVHTAGHSEHDDLADEVMRRARARLGATGLGADHDGLRAHMERARDEAWAEMVKERSLTGPMPRIEVAPGMLPSN